MMRQTMFASLFGLLSLIVFACLDIPTVQGQTVTRVMGAATSQALTPLNAVQICVSGCPLRTRPSYVDVMRLWGAASTCRTSTDGGATWGACLTQPFSSGAKENVAGTSDGAVIASAQVGTDCLISKSNDNGTTWTRRATFPTAPCGGSLVGSSQLQCYIDGSCTLIYTNGLSSYVVLRSADNGNNWATVHTSVLGGSAGVQALSYRNDGDTSVAAVTSGQRGLSGSGALWTVGSTMAGGVTCWGSYIFDASGLSFCYSGAGTIYGARSISNGALVLAPSLPNSNPAANSGGVCYQYSASVVYCAAAMFVVAGPLPVALYMSTDAGTTFTRVFTSLASTNSMREGDFWQHPLTGCLYLSAGSTPTLIRIC